MALICLDQSLKTPKYIAVFNLALVDVLGNTALVPKVIDTFWFDHKLIAITFPLRYQIILSLKTMFSLVAACWIVCILDILIVYPNGGVQRDEYGSIRLSPGHAHFLRSFDRLVAITFPFRYQIIAASLSSLHAVLQGEASLPWHTGDGDNTGYLGQIDPLGRFPA
ncbi:unnamed protein product [Boreogadus saida]